MRPALVALAVLLLGLLVAGGVFASRNLERVEVVREASPSGPAAANPYLALERFLGGMGVEAASSPLLAGEVDPELDLIFLLTPARTEWSERDQRLLDWVDEGNHLVVGALDADPFLEWLNLTRDGWRIQPGWGERYLEEPDLEEVTPALSATSMRRRGGDGRITVLTGWERLAGRGLGEPGRAELIWEVATLQRQPARALLIHEDRHPGLLELLWAEAWPAVTSALCLLAAWLWGASRRFGPVLPDPELSRRSLGEHVRAAGQLLWRHRRTASLLQGAREALRERLRARRPELAHLPDPELCARLAATLPVEQRALEHALGSKGRMSPDDLTRAVRVLQETRRSL